MTEVRVAHLRKPGWYFYSITISNNTGPLNLASHPAGTQLLLSSAGRHQLSFTEFPDGTLIRNSGLELCLFLFSMHKKMQPVWCCKTSPFFIGNTVT